MILNRRDFIKLAIGGAAAVVIPNSGCAVGTSSGAAAELPNIILIMADDLGYGDIGCYGSKKIRTPNIDALAREGLKFTDYHSNCPVCSPTRAALLTGRYQQRCGIEGVVTAANHRHTGMALEEVTFAEVLKKRGYATGIFGKWHVGYSVEFNPARQGFDEFIGYVSGNVDYHSHIDQAGFDDWWKKSEKIPEEGYSTDLITEHGVDFIERHKDRPFCLYLPHEAPHYPYQGRKDPPERLSGGRKGKKAKGDEIPRAYKEMVEVMDEGIGRIVETVKRLGLERKTFIFFCSDNGATKNGSNGVLAGYKGSLWEGGHRVPAVAYWPGKIKAGTTTDQTVLGMDLFATMTSIAGADLPASLKLDGVNLLPMLTEGAGLPKRTLFWRYKKQKAVRKGPWKLLVQNNQSKLYNLDEDLGEKENLALARPDILKTLEDELAAWEQEVSAGVELRA
ncbi:MAG: sulfatase-like hydrolase/transferase [Sedimentisphaerales bacterium]|nr:sulfatase-like hydrolase/transferase [Sedimentisphaerales bacterium]